MHAKNSKLAKVEIDRLADITAKMKSKLVKRAEIEKILTRHQFRGLFDVIEPRFTAFTFGLDGASSTWTCFEILEI